MDKADIEQVTVPDLLQLIESWLGFDKDQEYGSKYTKNQLEDYYGVNIVFSEKKGTPNVSLKKTASEILRQFYKQPKSADPETPTP